MVAQTEVTGKLPHVKFEFGNSKKVEKSWQEKKHVLSVANSLSTSLPTVDVSFTHANLVCHREFASTSLPN